MVWTICYLIVLLHKYQLKLIEVDPNSSPVVTKYKLNFVYFSSGILVFGYDNIILWSA